MALNNDYSRGYRTGRKFREEEFKELQQEVTHLRRDKLANRSERVYFSCLKLALEHCRGWKIGGEKVNTAEHYCTLAEIFARHSISKIP